MRKGIWITWELQRRNRGISSSLSWPLYEIRSNKIKMIRYASSILKTIFVIYKERPQYLVTQNPSIILSSLANIIKPLFKFVHIIDAHNSGLYPKEGKSRILMIISRWLQRGADITIVTNDSLKKSVNCNGGNAFVLPDKIPAVPKVKTIDLQGKYKLACISSFGKDEPYQSIIDAGMLIGNDTCIYMTGNYKGKVLKNIIPSNLKMLGYLNEQDFWTLLCSVDGIIDLTTRENCLVCGAYEGIAVGKPLILTNTKAIMNYFNRGCIYVSNNYESIAKGIKRLIKDKKILEKEIVELRNNLENEWVKQIRNFKNELFKLSINLN